MFTPLNTEGMEFIPNKKITLMSEEYDEGKLARFINNLKHQDERRKTMTANYCKAMEGLTSKEFAGKENQKFIDAIIKEYNNQMDDISTTAMLLIDNFFNVDCIY